MCTCSCRMFKKVFCVSINAKKNFFKVLYSAHPMNMFCHFRHLVPLCAIFMGVSLSCYHVCRVCHLFILSIKYC